MVVGASGADEPPGCDTNCTNTNSGAAYVYQNASAFVDCSSFNGKITASDAASFDLFGSSVDIDLGKIVVGAQRDDNENGSDAGAAYVYADTSPSGDWSFFDETKLIAGDGADVDEFGFSVSHRWR